MRNEDHVAWSWMGLLLAACGGASGDGGAAPTGGSPGMGAGVGGSSPTGGASAGAIATGGAAAGQAATGGAATGGATVGGAAIGGVASGGASGGQSGCTDTDMGPDYRRRGTATGTNGVFEDNCNQEGWLAEYTCETDFETDVPTGRVRETRVKCDLSCEDGVCYPACPLADDEVSWHATSRKRASRPRARRSQVSPCAGTSARYRAERSGTT
jgi:hypothetical protein